MWLFVTVGLLAVWYLTVGVFHVGGQAVHLLAVAAMASGAAHLITRRRRPA